MKRYPLPFLLLFNLMAQAQPRQVVLYIGDGFGLAPKTAARMALGQGQAGKRHTNDPGFQILALDKLKYQATVTTHSLNSWITDSAPGATVYACGEKGKVDNEVISFDPSTKEPIETILENAKKNGYAVGVITTTRITHATPAAFTSHSWSRDLEEYIALQQISGTQQQYEEILNGSPITEKHYQANKDWVLPSPKMKVLPDVLLGGGAGFYLPDNTNDTVKNGQNTPIKDVTGKIITLAGKRKDKCNLIKAAQKRGYVFVNSREALMSLNTQLFTSGNKKLLGLFNTSHLRYEQDRQLDAPWEPSLADMVEVAIKILKIKGGKKGFFLMVEGGRIDHLGHANAGCYHYENSRFTLESDSAAIPPDQGGNRLRKTAQGLVTGAEYMIKEVLAFDYAVAEGRKLLKEKNASTLLFSTSDHETGGFSVVGLHDQIATHNGGTGVRTYAKEITQSNVSIATPVDLVRGDNETNGWFPEYTLYDFQGRKFPKPASDTARRIVVAFGSNPLTNGNGPYSKGYIGNHTPQDIWVGADDNLQGKWASKITGSGLMDNTQLTAIMAGFLGLDAFVTYQRVPSGKK